MNPAGKTRRKVKIRPTPTGSCQSCEVPGAAGHELVQGDVRLRFRRCAARHSPHARALAAARRRLVAFHGWGTYVKIKSKIK